MDKEQFLKKRINTNKLGLSSAKLKPRLANWATGQPNTIVPNFLAIWCCLKRGFLFPIRLEKGGDLKARTLNFEDYVLKETVDGTVGELLADVDGRKGLDFLVGKFPTPCQFWLE